ncbi:MAG: HhH-GPD-type base excision DNA repair protein [Acidimicrobiia bacterium]
MKRPAQLHFTESDEANRLLATDDLAVLIGMLLDQQFPMERAFFGPQLLKERLGEDLDAARIARIDLSRLEEIFKGPPAIHRYPASMAKRTQDMCQVIVDEYDGDASQIWATAENGKELLKRLKALPGFGEGKSRIFVGLLGKRLGIRPEGWEVAAADWPSIADVATFDDVLELREQKRQMKQKKKESSG